jgi:N-acetylglucosaminyldiphosphoundecaprenol N-acetyl-beta-D-mannosaminyltransferase
MTPNRTITVLGTPVARVTYQSAFEIIQALAREPRPTAVCPSNTHILAEARHFPNFKCGTRKEIRPRDLKL